MAGTNSTTFNTNTSTSNLSTSNTRYYSQITPVHMPSSNVSLAGSSRLSNRMKLRAAIRRAKQSVKTALEKAFRRSAKKPTSGFVMPAEYRALHRSNSTKSRRSVLSTRSHRSVATVIPSMFRTAPTLKGRNKHYSVHELPPSPAMGKLQVSPVGARFSHPVVDAVIARPTTPIVDGDRASFESTDTWETEHDSSVDDAASTMTGLTAISKLTRSPSPTVSEFAGQVNPKAILRASYQSDQGMTIDIIKARLDGTKKPSNLGKQRPQTYQPPQSPTYKPYRPSSEPVPTISKHETQSLAPTVDAPKSVDKEDARAATLAQLNGLDSPELPASPEHPARPGLFRHTLYVNYSVPFQVPFGESDTTTVVVDESAGATMVSINKGKQAADPQVQLAIDANRAAFHARHSARYQRVESGLDDTPVRPRAPTPDSASRPDKTWSATAGEVGRALGIEALAPELPTPSRRSAYPSIEKQARRKPVAAKPESRIPRVSKSLPPSPAPDSARRFTNGVVPTRMNDSGYPVLNRSTVSFTTEPHYERR